MVTLDFIINRVDINTRGERENFMFDFFSFFWKSKLTLLCFFLRKKNLLIDYHQQHLLPNCFCIINMERNNYLKISILEQFY